MEAGRSRKAQRPPCAPREGDGRPVPSLGGDRRLGRERPPPPARRTRGPRPRRTVRVAASQSPVQAEGSPGAMAWPPGGAQRLSVLP